MSKMTDDKHGILVLLPLDRLESIQLTESVLTIQLDTDTAAELARSLARAIARTTLVEE